MARKQNDNSLLKVIATNMLAVLCLILFPFIAPIPGPGGIPLLLAAFGLFAINYDWADDAINYIKKHSESAREIIFPKKPLIQWSWDIFALFLLVGGTILNIYAEYWLLKGFSYGILASSSTLFMLNRDRLTWLDKQLKRTGKR